VLMNERLLRRGRLENYLGTFVSDVIMMKRSNAKAWDNLGVIMSELYAIPHTFLPRMISI
jgi:hypothetical protein